MLPCRFASFSHELFVFNLEKMLESDPQGIDRDAIANHQICELGRWLAAHEHELGALTHFVELRTTHQRFHEIAGEMVDHYRQGDVARGRLIQQTQFRDLSSSVIAAIDAMGSEMVK